MDTLQTTDFLAMTEKQLMAFWSAWRPFKFTPEDAQAFLGDLKVKDLEDVMFTLGAYAVDVACFKTLKADGQLNRAETYREGCRILREDLPLNVARYAPLP